uniref:Cyclic nucleotide-binding domain-containing protein n=1 Tax=Palpitomonas bilix TaxID=652834 RepID=A0A7S3GEL2_9EUKA|mmetsp:Transcript_46211/g.119085  ORF Transcript_46211/g.119085 Transcript_46211/m.119085 type:complete len:1355 (+) Transcript_46211:174-4238(+)
MASTLSVSKALILQVRANSTEALASLNSTGQISKDVQQRLKALRTIEGLKFANVRLLLCLFARVTVEEGPDTELFLAQAGDAASDILVPLTQGLVRDSYNEETEAWTSSRVRPLSLLGRESLLLGEAEVTRSTEKDKWVDDTVSPAMLSSHLRGYDCPRWKATILCHPHTTYLKWSLEQWMDAIQASFPPFSVNFSSILHSCGPPGDSTKHNGKISAIFRELKNSIEVKDEQIDDEGILSVLRSHPLFSKFPDRLLRGCYKHLASVRKFERGESIWKKGDKATFVDFIVSGTVTMRTVTCRVHRFGEREAGSSEKPGLTSPENSGGSSVSRRARSVTVSFSPRSPRSDVKDSSPASPRSPGGSKSFGRFKKATFAMKTAKMLGTSPLPSETEPSVPIRPDYAHGDVIWEWKNQTYKAPVAIGGESITRGHPFTRTSDACADEKVVLLSFPLSDVLDLLFLLEPGVPAGDSALECVRAQGDSKRLSDCGQGVQEQAASIVRPYMDRILAIEKGLKDLQQPPFDFSRKIELVDDVRKKVMQHVLESCKLFQMPENCIMEGGRRDNHKWARKEVFFPPVVADLLLRPSDHRENGIGKDKDVKRSHTEGILMRDKVRSLRKRSIGSEAEIALSQLSSGFSLPNSRGNSDSISREETRSAGGKEVLYDYLQLMSGMCVVSLFDPLIVGGRSVIGALSTANYFDDSFAQRAAEVTFSLATDNGKRKREDRRQDLINGLFSCCPSLGQFYFRPCTAASLSALFMPADSIAQAAAMVDDIGIKQRIGIVQDLSLFKLLERRHLRRVAGFFLPARLSPGAIVCTQGEFASGIFVVVKGELSVRKKIKALKDGEMYKEGGKGKRGAKMGKSKTVKDLLEKGIPTGEVVDVDIEIAVVGEGEIAGDLSIIGGMEDATTTVRSSDGAEVLFLPRERVENQLAPIDDVKDVVRTLHRDRGRTRNSRVSLLLSGLGLKLANTEMKGEDEIGGKSPFLLLPSPPLEKPVSQTPGSDNGTWLRQRGRTQLDFSRAAQKMRATFNDSLSTLDAAAREKAASASRAISAVGGTPSEVSLLRLEDVLHIKEKVGLRSGGGAAETKFVLSLDGERRGIEHASIGSQKKKGGRRRQNILQSSLQNEMSARTSKIHLRGENLKRSYGLEVSELSSDGVRGLGEKGEGFGFLQKRSFLGSSTALPFAPHQLQSVRHAVLSRDETMRRLAKSLPTRPSVATSSDFAFPSNAEKSIDVVSRTDVPIPPLSPMQPEMTVRLEPSDASEYLSMPRDVQNDTIVVPASMWSVYNRESASHHEEAFLASSASRPSPHRRAKQAFSARDRVPSLASSRSSGPMSHPFNPAECGSVAKVQIHSAR